MTSLAMLAPGRQADECGTQSVAGDGKGGFHDEALRRTCYALILYYEPFVLQLLQLYCAN